MNTINTSDLNIISSPEYGSFSKVYNCWYNNQLYKYKEFTKDFKLTKSFLKKIDDLSKINDKNLLVPIILILNNNEPVGYLVNYGDGTTIDNLCRESNINNQVKTLMQAKKTLLRMHDNGIIHTDLHYGNILYYKNDVKFIDFDNCQYKNHKTSKDDCFDYAIEFINKYGVCKELDITMFNYLTFSILNSSGNGYFRVRNDIKKSNYGEFYDDDSINICKSLLLEDKKPTKRFLIDTIRVK